MQEIITNSKELRPFWKQISSRWVIL